LVAEYVTPPDYLQQLLERLQRLSERLASPRAEKSQGIWVTRNLYEGRHH
jgi:hypothetical protein